MRPDSESPRPPVTGARKAAAFAIHLLTAAGAAVAFLALMAAIGGRWTEMFVWLGVALVIDAVDGALARQLKAAQILPRWSGDVLDLIVDYLTYVFVPAIAIASGAVVPEPLALPAAMAILISSAIYFSDQRMKTEDGYFRGFPALWNLVAFYLFLIQPDPYAALGTVVVLIVLTFVPILFVHPLRAKRFAGLNMTLLAVWAALSIVALAHDLAPPPAVILGLLAVAIYFVAAGFARTFRRTV